MPGPYDTLMSLSVGGATTLQLTDYSYKEEPIVKDAQGRVGTKATLAGEGFIDGTQTSDLGANLLAAIAAVSVSGRDIIVKGVGGGAELTLAAAAFVGGGPHITFEMMGSPREALSRVIKFIAVGETAPSGSSGTPVLNTFKVKITTRPDGLRQVVQSGDLAGPGVTAWFAGTILPDVLSHYLRTQWIPTWDIESNPQGDKATYTITFVELNAALPFVAGGAATAVDGEVVRKTDRDEQMRLVIDTSYDLLINGDPIALATRLRPSGIILKETIQYTGFKEVRLRAEFTQLFGGNGNPLLDFSQELKSQLWDDPQLDFATYPGSTPVYFKRNRGASHYVQSGRAVGLGKFPEAPTPILQKFYQPRDIGRRILNEAEFETTWSYYMISDAVIEFKDAQLKALARPANPTFTS